MSSEERRPCVICSRFNGKCTHDCEFAPFFPPENTRQVEMVHSANGHISVLQQNHEGVQHQHQEAKKELHFWLSRNLPPPNHDFHGHASAIRFQRFGGQEIGPVGPSSAPSQMLAREGTSRVNLGFDPQAYFDNAFLVQHPLQLGVHGMGPESSDAATQQLAMGNGGGASGLNLELGLPPSGDDAFQAPQDRRILTLAAAAEAPAAAAGAGWPHGCSSCAAEHFE